jgi:hypothetical protein
MATIEWNTYVSGINTSEDPILSAYHPNNLTEYGSSSVGFTGAGGGGIAIGSYVSAYNAGSFATCLKNAAVGPASFVAGKGNIGAAYAQTVVGMYNRPMLKTSSRGGPYQGLFNPTTGARPLFIVGGGSADDTRTNALEIYSTDNCLTEVHVLGSLYNYGCVYTQYMNTYHGMSTSSTINHYNSSNDVYYNNDNSKSVSVNYDNTNDGLYISDKVNIGASQNNTPALDLHGRSIANLGEGGFWRNPASTCDLTNEILNGTRKWFFANTANVNYTINFDKLTAYLKDGRRPVLDFYYCMNTATTSTIPTTNLVIQHSTTFTASNTPMRWYRNFFGSGSNTGSLTFAMVSSNKALHLTLMPYMYDNTDGGVFCYENMG